ncbi:MAG: GDP-mannose 4,6-dehydratase [Sphingobacteriia bacterium]|nr:GDP-mannose 4,6-dehydratase [Sphingobacteriia bacterium]
MSYLITGAAGFIGSYLCKTLCASNNEIIGIDNFNDYYNINLKRARLVPLEEKNNFIFYEVDIRDIDKIEEIAEKHNVTHIIHLAAQPGVRYSKEKPFEYSKLNVDGHLCILEVARNLKTLKHLIFASSSSVYGLENPVPFKEDAKLTSPASLYSATKIAGESMGYCYASQYNIPITALRFFTVYGPFGRPDMAVFSFTRSISLGEPIVLYEKGNLKRDFTYIDDIINGIIKVIPKIPNTKTVPFDVYNLGNNKSEYVKDMVRYIEEALGKKALIEFKPMFKGDMFETYADIKKAKKELGFEPKTSLKEGINKFVEWYKDFKY